MAARKARKTISRTERNRILSEAKSKGWTAQQVAKKFGISVWTYYGWRKRTGVAKPHVRDAGGRSRVSTTSITSSALRSEIRAVLPGILRDELARTLTRIVGLGTARRGRRGKR
jgi:transposase-like protein